MALSDTEIEDIVKEAVKNSPTAFNAQSPRAVILFGEAHEKLWTLTEAALEPLTPPEAFEATKQKLAGFKAGYGTVLFFIHTDTVKNLQEQFALYAENFPVLGRTIEWDRSSERLDRFRRSWIRCQLTALQPCHR